MNADGCPVHNAGLDLLTSNPVTLVKINSQC